MAIIVTDSQHYTDIANAIRLKSGNNTQLKPGEMANAISNITGGASVQEHEYGEVTIPVSAWDGTTATVQYYNATVYNTTYTAIAYLPRKSSTTNALALEKSGVYLTAVGQGDKVSESSESSERKWKLTFSCIHVPDVDVTMGVSLF